MPHNKRVLSQTTNKRMIGLPGQLVQVERVYRRISLVEKQETIRTPTVH